MALGDEEVKTFLRASITFMILTAILACKETSQELPPQTSDPTPAAIPVEQLYSGLKEESNTNPARLRHRETVGEWFRFRGRITKIEDKKIQFHIQEKQYFFDLYVECNFRSNARIISANMGDEVALWGSLERALRTHRFDRNANKVILKDCLLSQIYAETEN